MPTPFNASLTSGSGLIPGANFGGGNMAVPGASDSARVTDTLGSSGSNPLLPQFPGGTQTPPMRDTINQATPNGGGGQSMGTGSDIAGIIGGVGGGGSPQGNWAPNQNDFIKAMRKSGFSAGVAGMLYNFIQGGAGFNPQAIQMLIDAQRPGVERKEADIMEWFGSKGLGNSGSAPAIAMGDFLANEQLLEGQIWAGMYEQSVQNYMNVLMGGKGNPPQSTFQNIMQWMNQATQSSLAGAKIAGGG